MDIRLGMAKNCVMSTESEIVRKGAEALPSSSNDTAQAVSKIQKYLEVGYENQFLFPRAALFGLCAGSVAIVFRGLLLGAETLLNVLLGWCRKTPTLGRILPIFYSATGATLAAILGHPSQLEGQSI